MNSPENAGADSGPWTLTETGWDPHRANYFETVFTIGNGRLGIRGSLEEGHTGALPGTFLAGVYDGHDSPVTDLVNVHNGLLTEVFVDGERLDTESMTVLEHHRELDLATGVLHRETVFSDSIGRRTRLRSWRLASMADRDLVAQRIEITTLGHPAPVTVRTGVDGHRRNLERLPAYPDGTSFGYDRKWDKWARSTHLAAIGHGSTGGIGYLVATTIATDVTIAVAAEAIPVSSPVASRRLRHHEFLGEELDFRSMPDEPIVVDKLVGFATSRDPGERDPGDDSAPADQAVDTVARHAAGGWPAALRASADRWRQLWQYSDCELVGDEKAALAMRLGLYHLLIAANPDDPTVSIGAKSLSGEGYRGHVFWDTEIMMLPFFLYTQPATARALLAYRHHTLPGARAVSAENGTRGARFPWESAESGLEECPRFTPDGKNRFYTREEEVHVSADVAYGYLRYAQVTGDEDFLYDEGAEILFETSRFWVDRVSEDGDRLSLRTVMGPDEFHSHVDNNAFTNRMVVWQLRESAALYRRMAERRPEQLAKLAGRIGLTPGEPETWLRVADRILVTADDETGVIPQFDGYLDRLDVPITEWDANDMPRYPAGYNHFNCEETMLLKQPDVVMLMYLFPDWLPERTRRLNYDFYEARTLHKSSLSPSIHAIVGLQVGDSSKAKRYFERSAFVDLDDNQGNTEEGMHIASAGGTWQIAVNGFGGFRYADDGIHFDPRLPRSWRRLRFTVQVRGQAIRADLGHQESTFELLAGDPVEILLDGAPVLLQPGVPVTVETGERVPA